MDEPTAALGVKETGMVLDLIRSVEARGVPVILISHYMPIFEVTDRISVMRLGKRAGILRLETLTMEDAIAMITGASKQSVIDIAEHA